RSLSPTGSPPFPSTTLFRSVSVALDLSLDQALQHLSEWGTQPLPITAACHDGERLRLRFEGNEGSVRSARERIGGEQMPGTWWRSEEHTSELQSRENLVCRL